MNAPTSHGLPLVDRSAAPFPGVDGSESPIHRWASDRALYAAIGRHLGSARSRLEEIIAACVLHEPQTEPIEVDDRGQAAPRRWTEIDTLERLTQHLERVASRFHEAMALTEVDDADGPLDIARTSSVHRLDLTLAERAGELDRRFVNPEVGQDLQAAIESDLCDFELVLDERAPLPSRDGRGRDTEKPDRTGAVRPAEGFGMAEGDRNRGGRDEGLSDAFEEHINALRQADRALRRIGRCVTEARGDPSLQGFWRGVKRDFEEEVRRLALQAGEEAIRPSRIGF